jgi:Na+/H+ antiporter NhaD/arsenite permease-like protein
VQLSFFLHKHKQANTTKIKREKQKRKIIKTKQGVYMCVCVLVTCLLSFLSDFTKQSSPSTETRTKEIGREAEGI